MEVLIDNKKGVNFLDSNAEKPQSCLDNLIPEEQKKENNESELILIQDNAFTLKIQVPGLEPFDLQVNYIIHFKLKLN